MADFNPDELNNEVKAWAALIKAELKAQISANGLYRSGKLFSSVNTRFRFTAGEISQIAIGAGRHGFVQSHVGRKYTWKAKSITLGNPKFVDVIGKNGRHYRIPRRGKVTMHKMGNKYLTNGSGNRDWIWKILDVRSNQLATKIAYLDINRVVKASSAIQVNAKNIANL